MVDLNSLVRRYKLSKMSDNVLSDIEIKVCNFLIGYLKDLVSYKFGKQVYYGNLDTDNIIFYIHDNRDLNFAYNSMIAIEVVVYDTLYDKGGISEDFIGQIDCNNLVEEMIHYIYPEYASTKLFIDDLMGMRFSKIIEDEQ